MPPIDRPHQLNVLTPSGRRPPARRGRAAPSCRGPSARRTCRGRGGRSAPRGNAAPRFCTCSSHMCMLVPSELQRISTGALAVAFAPRNTARATVLGLERWASFPRVALVLPELPIARAWPVRRAVQLCDREGQAVLCFALGARAARSFSAARANTSISAPGASSGCSIDGASATTAASGFGAAAGSAATTGAACGSGVRRWLRYRCCRWRWRRAVPARRRAGVAGLARSEMVWSISAEAAADRLSQRPAELFGCDARRGARRTSAAGQRCLDRRSR